MNKTLRLKFLGQLIAVAFGLAGPRAAEPGATPPAKYHNLPSEVRSFAQAKETQARAMSRNLELTIDKDVWTFFDLASEGKGAEARELYQKLGKRSGQYADSKPDPGMANPVWQTVLEVELAVEAFGGGDPKFAFAIGREIIAAIPPGSIFFGGADIGRGLPSCLSKLHQDGDPFFTITQNALAEGDYVTYLREMYGERVHLFSTEESKQAFDEYLADARDRLNSGKLKPGEQVWMTGERVTVAGQVAVMSINALLAKMIFDKNPRKQFYLEESFPLDWMYPHLTPHGLIMKIQRLPVPELSSEMVRRDEDFWREVCGRLLGTWLSAETPVEEVCRFAEKVYFRHDLLGFEGDPKFAADEPAQGAYSKLRASLGGVYAWRLDNAQSAAEKARMYRAADLAFRQALALCPYSPEAVFRYVDLSLKQKRTNDALLVARLGSKLAPKDEQIKGLVTKLLEVREHDRKAGGEPGVK